MASRGNTFSGGDRTQRSADEYENLAALSATVRQHHQRIGTADRLEDSVSQVISGALEKADRRDLAESLSPLVVNCIRRELRNSRGDIVEGLYPMVGRLISAYAAYTSREFRYQADRRLESILTGRFIRLRVKSWVQGIPYKELALRERILRQLRDIEDRVRELLRLSVRPATEPPLVVKKGASMDGRALLASDDREAIRALRDELRRLDRTLRDAVGPEKQMVGRETHETSDRSHDKTSATWTRAPSSPDYAKFYDGATDWSNVELPEASFADYWRSGIPTSRSDEASEVSSRNGTPVRILPSLIMPGLGRLDLSGSSRSLTDGPLTDTISGSVPHTSGLAGSPLDTAGDALETTTNGVTAPVKKGVQQLGAD